jgi:hypothetical protein
LESPVYEAPIVSEPATSAKVVQVAVWLASTTDKLQPPIVVPFDVKATVPEGAIGVNATPESRAVIVTAAFTFDGPVLDKPSTGVSFEAFWKMVLLLELKFESLP